MSGFCVLKIYLKLTLTISLYYYKNRFIFSFSKRNYVQIIIEQTFEIVNINDFRFSLDSTDSIQVMN